MKKLIYLSVIVLFSCTNQPNEYKFPDLSGEYLGQELPGDSSLLFAPGIISTGAGDRDIAITPDGEEIYFCREMNNFKFATILVTKLENGKWTEPEVLEFCQNPDYLYFEPHISPDGKKLFFVSNMPKDSTKNENIDIWVAEREGDGWGTPYNIGAPVNTDSREYFPSVTNDGTMYYTHFDAELNDEFIYRSKYVNGKYTDPKKIDAVNLGRGRFNTLIARDESVIIVPMFGMTDAYGGTDYYIFFRNEEDKWSKPINMGAIVNTENMNEWSPSISPDGKFFFYMSAKIPADKNINIYKSVKNMSEFYNLPQNGNSDIYWVRVDFIKNLKNTAEF